MDFARIIKRSFFAALLLILGLLPFSCTLTGGSGDGLVINSLFQLVPDIRVLPGGTTQIKTPLAGSATGEEEPEAVLAERKNSEGL